MKPLLELKGEGWSVQLRQDNGENAVRMYLESGSEGVAHYWDIPTTDAIIAALTAARDEAKRMGESHE